MLMMLYLLQTASQAVDVCTALCMRVRLCACVRAHVCVCACVCVRACVRAHVCVRVRARALIQLGLGKVVAGV